MLNFIMLIFICFMGLKIYSFFKIKPGNKFDIYFGVPGCGKTTFAAWIAKKSVKKKKTVLSNVPIRGTYKVTKQDIGNYQIKDCNLIIDEAGVDYNNRKFKTFSDEEVYFFKYHRHYNVDVSIFSQGYNDMDLKLRTLATQFYVVKKSFIPFFIKRKLILKKIGIDKMTHEIKDEYYFALFGSKYIFMPSLWKMFDSYSYKELPTKEFEPY